MSLRATSEAVAGEILEAWFAAGPSTDEEDAACFRWLAEAEERHCR